MSSNIKVGIKFRPVTESENKNIQWIVNGNNINSKNSKYNFTFANVFNETSSNEDVYKTLGSSIVQQCLQGYNGTIMTYGQTSSGKTFTMMGNENVKGIVELTIDDIFREIDTLTEKSFALSVGFIEIYNEKVYDLLAEKKQKIKIFGDETNQKQITINTKEDILKILEKGNCNRQIAATSSNDRSSRSHTILSINFESNDKSSKLFLVDLAGSEKPDITRKSFNEGLHINKSLLALGKIIRQLSDKNVNIKNMRFRESILTRLLSSSLGGNSNTSIICTASPVSLDETFYTICFAQNAEKAKCKPKVNSSILNDSKEVTLLKKEVNRLQKELDLEKSRVLDESSIAINTTYIISKSIEIENTNKRDRNEMNETFNDQPTKVFIKSIVEDEGIIKSLREQIEEMKIENENLKIELNDYSGELSVLKSQNESMRNQLKNDAQKKLKFQQKIRFVKEKYFQKKEEIATLKTQIKDQSMSFVNIDDSETALMHKNLIIHALEQKLSKMESCKSHSDIIMEKNYEIANLNNQINLLKSANSQDNYNHQVLEQKLREQLESTLSAYQIIQSQLYESHLFIEQLTNERDEVRKLSSSLKVNFKNSLKNTREQFHNLLEQKQHQATDFREQLIKSRNEELRNYIKLQNHFEQQLSALKTSNRNQEIEIEQLNVKLNEFHKMKNNIDDFAKERRHESEKIKFIKHQFEMKLNEKVNNFEKLLIEKEKELNALKNLALNHENNYAEFQKVLIAN